MNWLQLLGALGIGVILTKLLDILWLTRVVSENERRKWLRDQRLAAYADVAKDFLSFGLGGARQHDNPFQGYAVASRAILLAHNEALARRIGAFIVDLDRFHQTPDETPENEQLYVRLNTEARAIVGALRNELVSADSEGPTLSASSKSALVRSAAFGAGIALIIVAMLGVFTYWRNRPPIWNHDAITASFNSINTEGSDRKLVFIYVLTNNSDRDFTADSNGKLRVDDVPGFFGPVITGK